MQEDQIMTKHNQSAKAMAPSIVQPVKIQFNGITQEIACIEVYLSDMFTEEQRSIIEDNLNRGITTSIVQIFRLETVRRPAHDAA